jgi:glycosyltransferase involved in cell wall biosynthesis
MSASLSVSVVVITKDEAPRLALTLAALEHDAQAREGVEVVVVNDGSTDDTPAVLDDAASRLPLRVVRHETAKGRSAARNAGARAATNDVLLFCDGDVLLAPGALDEHARALARGETWISRGHTMHLRCTRFFHDPELGTPMPGAEERLTKMSAREKASCLVTRAMVRDDFAAIVSRAESGIYPGSGPRRLYELETQAFDVVPRLSCLWMAVSGHNLGVRRRTFVDLGGFDERLSINEHRELALRAHERGGGIALVAARSYHLTHRVGFRDPVRDDSSWEKVFHSLHPTPASRLMAFFWQSIAGDAHIPASMRIDSLARFEAILEAGGVADYDALRRTHPLLGVLDAGTDSGQRGCA